MASIFPHTPFGTKFKHAQGVYIVMGYIESLSTYTNYWKSYLVPRFLLGKINHPVQLAQWWN